MRPLLILITFLSLSFQSFSQKIHFTDTGNRWQITGLFIDMNQYHDYSNTIYHFTADTVIGSVIYKRLNGFMIREDTALGKVFVKGPCLLYQLPYNLDTNEQVLYDYDLRLNDTVKYRYGNDTQLFKITAFDSTIINGAWHKTWKYKTINTILQDASERTVIEGIGSTGGFWWPLQYWFFEHTMQLTCFYTLTGQPPVSPAIDNYFDNSHSCTLAINSGLYANMQKLSVVPKPANAVAQIECSQSIQNGSLALYNIIGQQVYKTAINNQNILPIGRYISMPGTYFYRVVDMDKNQVYSGKFAAQ